MLVCTRAPSCCKRRFASRGTKNVLEASQGCGIFVGEGFEAIGPARAARSAKDAGRRFVLDHVAVTVALGDLKLIGHEDAELHGRTRVAPAHQAVAHDGKSGFARDFKGALAAQAGPGTSRHDSSEGDVS